jgi:hypothetical protein
MHILCVQKMVLPVSGPVLGARHLPSPYPERTYYRASSLIYAPLGWPWLLSYPRIYL